jgi:hypothetical protein
MHQGLCLAVSLLDLYYAVLVLMSPVCRCSLTGHVFKDPVIAADGHTYGRQHPACVHVIAHTHVMLQSPAVRSLC